MAVVAAGAGAPFPIGTFALVSRPPEFDEVWVAAHGPVSGELLVRTTTDDGSEWMWAVVLPGAGQMVAPTAVGDNRRPPHGVGPNAVNWLCVPPNAQEKWRPSAAESMTLIRDATQLVAQLQMAGAGSYPVNAAGTAGKLEPVQLPVVTAATAPLVPVPPAAPGGVGGGGGPAVAALGLSGEVAVPSGQAPNVDLKALEAAVAQLQALSLKDRKVKKDRDKDRKESKKKKKKKSRKSRKKKKRRSSSSSSSSSRSRSRSSSSSSSSSGSSGRKPLRWKEDGKDRQVSYSDLAHVDGLKWKKKGDLVAFAAKHPGALTAHFLAGVYARLSKGSLSRTRQLREASVASWAHQFSGLSEIRDMKEVLTMAEVLDSVNRREIERAMDILCQRILAIQAAKLGESRGHRVGEHPEVPGQQWYAGFDERLIRRFRQAMSLRGAVGQDPMGFGACFSAVVGSLAYALQGGIGLDCSLGQEVHRVHRLLRELNKTSVSPLRGGRSGHSPAHVFPLPPISSGTSRSADRDLSVCPGLLEGANLVVAALNSLFGGQFEAEVRSPPTAAHRRVHARIVCALEAMVLTDEPTLSGVGWTVF